MCGGGILGTIGSAAGSFFGGPLGGAIGGAVGGLLGGRKSKGASAPDAASEQRAKEVEAINKANASMAMRRKALRDNSLFTGAGEADKTTLGVGG